MKFTYGWLQDYIDTADLTPEQLAEKLTMLGLEVEGITKPFAELNQIVTAEVEAAKKHPDADKLSVCMVNDGNEVRQIVCGAPNVRAGLKVAVALPQTILPGGLKIKKSKIRGVESHGMICSERELGLGTGHDGILELSQDTLVGISLLEALGLDDPCIEVDLTPNRPDCTAVVGIAREVGSITDAKIRYPDCKDSLSAVSSSFEVSIEEAELCPRYAARLISGVTVSPSPWWLKKKLLSVGLRPINAIVDITNFVMLELGQPLHAFDFDTLDQGQIVVRKPREDEPEFTTLDGTKRKLDPEMLMICDGKEIIGVAGVMGGLNSEVTEKTTNILLESAYFNPVSVRKTARGLNLSTDASYRFERGVDPEGTVRALNRAAELIAELGGGTLEEGGIDCHPVATTPLSLELNVARTNTLLGLDLDAQAMASLLESIELEVEICSGELLRIAVPSYRIDLEREADLVEEVARLYGYDNIPTTLPKVDMSYPEQDMDRLQRLQIAEKLVTMGQTEAINYSFISATEIASLGFADTDQRNSALALLNPLSEDQALMRTTLLPGLLANVRRNINFQKPSPKLFELGKVFFPKEAGRQPDEKFRLAGILCGSRYPQDSPSLYFKDAPVDIYDAKGLVEFIVSELGLLLANDKKGLYFNASREKNLEPFSEAGYEIGLYHGEEKIGSLGKVRSEICRSFGIKAQVYYYDLDFDFLCGLEKNAKKFSALPVYPSVVRDIALVVKESVDAQGLIDTVYKKGDKLIVHCELFDVYQGDKIPEGYKSVALTLTYRSPTKTLTEKNVEKSHSKIVRMLTEEFGGSLRDA